MLYISTWKPVDPLKSTTYLKYSVTSKKHTQSTFAQPELRARWNKERQREWKHRDRRKGAEFGGMLWFYAPDTVAPVSGNRSVVSSQDSTEDLIVCHFINQSITSGQTAQILQRQIPLGACPQPADAQREVLLLFIQSSVTK